MKFSQHVNTQYNHKERVLLDVKSVFSGVRCFRPTHSKILEMLNARVYNSNSFNRLTQSRREYIYGYIAALHNNIYSMLDWRLRVNDDWVIANPNTSDLESHPDWTTWMDWMLWSKNQEKNGYEINGHFWKIQTKDKRLYPFSNIDIKTNRSI